MPLKRKIRVLCVDDHDFLVDGLKYRLELEDDLECVGRMPSAEGLVERARELRPHVVLMDIEMPGPDPFDAMSELRRLHPEIHVIILSAHVRDRYIDEAFKHGAWGYFSKSDDPREIVEGVRKAAPPGGEFAFGPSVLERCRRTMPTPRASVQSPPASRLDSLSPRELQVLRMIASGLSRGEIAQQLHRSPKTVDVHCGSIMEKLGIHDRVGLTRYAIAEGLAEV